VSSEIFMRLIGPGYRLKIGRESGELGDAGNPAKEIVAIATPAQF
jgi:hypothetical protein